MQQVSASDLTRLKRLQLLTNSVHVQENPTGLPHRLAITLPIRITSVNHPKFTETASNKNFTSGRFINSYIPRPIPEFTPLNIAGLMGWFDASDSSTITFELPSKVSGLADKSGRGFNLSQLNTSLQPTLVPSVIGGKSVLRCTATTEDNSTYLANASALSDFLGTGPLSLMLVERNMGTAGGTNPGPLRFEFGPNFGNIFQYNTGFLPGFFQPFGSQTVLPPTPTDFDISPQWTSPTGRFDYFNRTATGSNGIGSVDGALKKLNDATTTPAYSGEFSIGRAQNGGLNGDIGEVIMYKSNLSDFDRQRLEGYVAWKWGLVGNLPSNHPYKSVRPQA